MIWYLKGKTNSVFMYMYINVGRKLKAQSRINNTETQETLDTRDRIKINKTKQNKHTNTTTLPPKSQVVIKGKQFLFLTRHLQCYSMSDLSHNAIFLKHNRPKTARCMLSLLKSKVSAFCGKRKIPCVSSR